MAEWLGGSLQNYTGGFDSRSGLQLGGTSGAGGESYILLSDVGFNSLSPNQFFEI